MKQVAQEENKLVSMTNEPAQSVSLLGQTVNASGSIRERVAAVRKDGKQNMVCDAGFCN